MTELDYSRRIPVTETADLVVCGAGPAGFMAAISAARRGLDTILIDRYGFPGGTASAGYVLPISGYYLNGTRVVSDLALEFAKRLEEKGAAIFEFPKGHISYDPESYKTEAEAMLCDAGVRFISNAYISDCIKDGGKITHVIVNDKNGTEAIAARMFIDCTGDADLCRFAGVPLQPLNSEMQPLSLCFILSGVDTGTDLLRDCIHHTGLGGKGSQNNEIRDYLLSCPTVDDFCGPWFNSTVKSDNIAVNITRSGTDALDNRAYGAAERKLRQDMFRITELLRARYPEFKNCTIASSGFNAGIRETRRILGKYTFTGDDLSSGRVLPSPVACCAHPIDIHHKNGGGQTLIKLKTLAMIPLDSLTPGGFENLMAAGRCASLDPVAMASARVQGTCMTMGDAAGVAAAFTLEKGLRTDRLTEGGFRFEDMERLRSGNV